jgi:hypothetical protein
MVILFGTHRFSPKKIGVRKDFCGACERECIAEQWQSFDCGHIFFIPVLPLGTRARWRCSLCGKDPRARYATNRPLRIIGLFVLPLFFLPMLFVHSDHVTETPGEAYAPYIVAALFGLAWVYLLYATFFKRPGPSVDQRRGAVTPLSTEVCFYCHGELRNDPYCHCQTCGIRVYTALASSPLRPPPLAAASATVSPPTATMPESGRCSRCGFLRAHASGCPNA